MAKCSRSTPVARPRTSGVLALPVRPPMITSGIVQFVDQYMAQRLIATGDQGYINPRITQPLLGDVGAHAAAPAIEMSAWMIAGKSCPCVDTPLLDRTAHQLMAQRNGRLLALLFVTGANLLAFTGGEDGSVVRGGKTPRRELDLGPHIEKRCVVQE